MKDNKKLLISGGVIGFIFSMPLTFIFIASYDVIIPDSPFMNIQYILPSYLYEKLYQNAMIYSSSGFVHVFLFLLCFGPIFGSIGGVIGSYVGGKYYNRLGAIIGAILFCILIMYGIFIVSIYLVWNVRRCFNWTNGN